MRYIVYTTYEPSYLCNIYNAGITLERMVDVLPRQIPLSVGPSRNQSRVVYVDLIIRRAREPFDWICFIFVGNAHTHTGAHTRARACTHNTCMYLYYILQFQLIIVIWQWRSLRTIDNDFIIKSYQSTQSMDSRIIMIRTWNTGSQLLVPLHFI